ncbi:MAG: TrmH family RNA methyltransferase [Clostridia bacterium]|nr:TrmH family RNA methyltransferase [Clostridia bacterium]
MRKLLNSELNRPDAELYKQMQKLPCVVVLDNVRSQHNIGSVFRTSDAFRMQAVYLCGITATPPHREIHKTALGATESVDWKYFEDTLQALQILKAEGYKIYCIEQATDSIPLKEFKIAKSEKIALVFGHEVHGVSQEVVDACHGCIEIKQYGTKHSLNVSVCAGIVIWEIFGKYDNVS